MERRRSFVLRLRLAILLSVMTASAPALAADAPRKAPMPDYDGLGRANETTTGEVLAWIPRVAVFPLYAVTEFGVRRPVGALARTAEKHHWAGSLYDLFTSDDGKIGFMPSAFFDFGVRPSVGFYFFWNELGAKKNDVRFHFGTWGPTWINVNAVDRYRFSSDTTFNMRAAFSHRRDLYFNGIGPASTNAHESRYEMNRLDVGPSFVVGGWRYSSLEIAGGVRRVDYYGGSCCGVPSLAERAARGAFPIPEQYGTPYTTVYQRGRVVLDSRRPAPHPGTGTRIEAYGEPAFSIRSATPASWVRYGASIGQTVDLNGRQRNLSLTASADFADPVTGSTVPFNEQVALGGGQAPAGSFVETKMRGFRYGRLIDRSAVAMTLQYTWPVWFLLEGVVQIATGNVFGAGVHDFSPDLLRMSGVIGVRTNQRRDTHFEILVGTGTQTFRDGMALESFRLAIGTTHGF